MAKRSIKNAFNAAKNLLQKMPAAQRNQIMQQAGNMFGGGPQFTGLGSANNMQAALEAMDPKQQAQMMQQLSGLFNKGPGGNIPPGAPPIRVNNPDAFFGGPELLNPGPIQGTMGMTPQQGNQNQTLHQQKVAQQQQGAQPATLPSAPGTVNTGQLMGAVNNSPGLNAPLFGEQQQFQAQFNPIINLPGQNEMLNQLTATGQSTVGGPYGTGGMMGGMYQQMQNQAAMQGLQARQGMVGQNLQHDMQAQQLQSQMDMGLRQQLAQQTAGILGPAAAGASAGMGTALAGATRAPQIAQV
tara:strand:+ start:121 stop:1014 length:894 start_codon:yes stop_codon:yes gene_type:complete